MAARTRLQGESIVGVFRSMEDVRTAVESLEQQGIEGGDISVEGTGAPRTPGQSTMVERDAGVTKRIAWFGLTGSLAGAVAGALVGLVIGLLWFDTGWALWTAVLGMAGVGMAIGGLVLPTAKLGMSPSWEKTQTDTTHGHDMVVRVRRRDDQRDSSVMETLRMAKAYRVDVENNAG